MSESLSQANFQQFFPSAYSGQFPNQERLTALSAEAKMVLHVDNALHIVRVWKKEPEDGNPEMLFISCISDCAMEFFALYPSAKVEEDQPNHRLTVSGSPLKAHREVVNLGDDQKVTRIMNILCSANHDRTFTPNLTQFLLDPATAAAVMLFLEGENKNLDSILKKYLDSSHAEYDFDEEGIKKHWIDALSTLLWIEEAELQKFAQEKSYLASEEESADRAEATELELNSSTGQHSDAPEEKPPASSPNNSSAEGLNWRFLLCSIVFSAFCLTLLSRIAPCPPLRANRGFRC